MRSDNHFDTVVHRSYTVLGTDEGRETRGDIVVEEVSEPLIVATIPCFDLIRRGDACPT